jgi:hypothetical protein
MCDAENIETSLRCSHCDEWLMFYEFEDDQIRAKKDPSKYSPQPFLPDSLVDESEEILTDSAVENIALLTRSGSYSEILTPDDAAALTAFSPECPNCGGTVKPYEVRCRHCAIMLTAKIEAAKKMKPYWESIFRDKVLTDGRYEDVYSGSEIKFLFKRVLDKGNKMILYMFFALVFLLASGALLMFCVGSLF